jgi:DNA-binding phage protein
MTEKAIITRIKKEVAEQKYTTYRMQKNGVNPFSYNRAIKNNAGFNLSTTIKLCKLLGLKLTVEKIKPTDTE